MSADTRRHGMGLDSFLNHSNRGGGGAYLSSWKKDGRILVWLHSKEWSAPCWNHPLPRLVEPSKDKDADAADLRVSTSRWVCHESEATLKRQYFREKSGAREFPPELCPFCLVIECVHSLVKRGKLGWLDPVFEWLGDGPDDSLVITAGGMYNAFRAKDIGKEQLREMKRAGIRMDEAWKQDLRARLQYLFLVVDDADVEAGVQKTFETVGLANHLKKAIRDEMRRNETRGNPSLRPYPFEWTYDEAEQFDKRYDVLAMTDREMTDAIRRLIVDEEAPDVSRDLEPGNCYQLRVELETHLAKGVSLPFDEIFEAARKAGLMEPPKETKEAEDLDDEDGSAEQRRVAGGRAYEVKGQAAEPEEFVVEPGNAVWKEGWKRAPVRIPAKAEVHLDPPDSASDERVEEVRAAVAKLGYVVGMFVECDHCAGRMLTLDVDCPGCGSTYDDDGKLVTRPCLADGCGGQVALAGAEAATEGGLPRAVCGKCGSIHEIDASKPGDEGWRRIELTPARPAEPAAPRRSRRAAAAAAVASTEAGREAAGAPRTGESGRRGSIPFG